MKLRLRGNTIRLRLKREEVDQIGSGESIIEQTRFPDTILTYRLDVSDDDRLVAEFGDGRLVVQVPRSSAAEWAVSDQVSLLAEQELGDAETLSILVEKDFRCLTPGDHRPSDDDEDTFPHPGALSGDGC